MVTHIHFKCYRCCKGFYTKQNLRMVLDHLVCEKCYENLPTKKSLMYEISYRTQRNLIKVTRLRSLDFDSETSMKEFIFSKMKAKEIISFVPHVIDVIDLSAL